MTDDQEKPKVGILTWHYYSNVGSNLQAWAMQRVLGNMGFDSQFVNYRKYELDGDRFPKSAVKAFLDVLPLGSRFDTWRFQHSELRQTRKTYDPVEAATICDGFDVVVCGSDQIWAPNVFDPVYMLDGVSSGVRKVSYAASIGIPVIPEDLKPEYSKLLSRFDAISVREEQGRRLLEGLGIHATTVLDPTLLLGREEWDVVAASGATEPACVFCYFLGDPSRYASVLDRVSNEGKERIVAYLPEGGESPVPGCRIIRRMGPAEFLSWIRSSDIVLTDSFHGIALSVVYGTEFIAFKRFSAGSPVNQNSRVENILSKLGLMHRLSSHGAFPEDSIAWGDVYQKLEAERKASWAFLRDALGVHDA